MQKYSFLSLIKNAFSDHQNWEVAWKDPTPKKEYDVIIIGAGHNGMAASIKLAKTGRKVLILESSSEFGGMASSNILLNDNVNQPLPHLINHLCSKSIKDLDLIKYGLISEHRVFLSLYLKVKIIYH